jgi:hypothetical protein
MQNSGWQYFERSFSVDSVEVQAGTGPLSDGGARTDVETSQLLMIAAHAWDMGGTIRAGCAAAFVAARETLFRFSPPSIVGRDLGEVSAAIIANRVEGVTQRILLETEFRRVYTYAPGPYVYRVRWQKCTKVDFSL